MGNILAHDIFYIFSWQKSSAFWFKFYFKWMHNSFKITKYDVAFSSQVIHVEQEFGFPTQRESTLWRNHSWTECNTTCTSIVCSCWSRPISTMECMRRLGNTPNEVWKPYWIETRDCHHIQKYFHPWEHVMSYWSVRIPDMEPNNAVCCMWLGKFLLGVKQAVTASIT